MFAAKVGARRKEQSEGTLNLADYGIATMPARNVLAENLKALMAASTDCKSMPALERATALRGNKVGKSTIDRAIKGEANLTIDNLEVIAKVFGVDPWQLLVPGMQPKNPPVLRTIGAAEEAVYARMRELADEVVKLPGPAGGRN